MGQAKISDHIVVPRNRYIYDSKDVYLFIRNIRSLTIVGPTPPNNSLCDISKMTSSYPCSTVFCPIISALFPNNTAPLHQGNAYVSWINDFLVWKFLLYSILQQKAFKESPDKQYDIFLFHIFPLKQILQVLYNIFDLYQICH